MTCTLGGTISAIALLLARLAATLEALLEALDMGVALETAAALLDMLEAGTALTVALETAETLLEALDTGMTLTVALETAEALLETLDLGALEIVAKLLVGRSGLVARLLKLELAALEILSLADTGVFSLLPLPPHALKAAAKEIAKISLEKAGKADNCIKASCK